MNYITITSFTIAANKTALIHDIEAAASEEVPMIRFLPIEVNKKLADWIEQTLK